MRWAFVMGSNGPTSLSPLRYAHTDAERMRNCLESPRCGFQVLSPKPKADTFEIRRQLYKAAESCSSEDSFICYFSGHGVLDKGSLFLFWNDTDINRLGSTSIPISDVLQAFSFCKAHSTLLILDCCHAGAAVNMTGLKRAVGEPVEEIIQPSNHLVIMASDRLEKARELEELEGGFLTVNICSALSNCFHAADTDDDSRLSIQELMQWLQKKALEHNQSFPEKTVPYPYTFGQERGSFYLTAEESRWSACEIPWIDGSTMVVLPVKPMSKKDLALCISKHPITNSQYRKFVEATGAKEPVGKDFKRNALGDGKWTGPFSPWNDEKFSAFNKPVVCVSYSDAINYCGWVNKLESKNDYVDGYTFLPSARLWELAAFGVDFLIRNPSTWLSQSEQLHHMSDCPISIDLKGSRVNSRGVSDMFGNVWEWCSDWNFHPYSHWNAEEISFLMPPGINPLFYFAALNDDPIEIPDLRGGGFLDDLSKVEPFLSIHRTQDKENTRHSDLGFRLAGVISVDHLPDNVQLKLSMCKPYNPLRVII